MDQFNTMTQHIATVLTETQSSYKWCLDFFFAVRVAEWTGKYAQEESHFRDKFRELVTKGFPSQPGPFSINPDKVQWRELYDYCYEKTSTLDKFKTRETERLAGLLTLTPANRLVIDFLKQGIKAHGIAFGDDLTHIQQFRNEVDSIIFLADISNLDLDKVDWHELLTYCRKKLEWAIAVD